MKKSRQIITVIVLMASAMLFAGCGIVNTDRDNPDDPRSGNYRFPNLVLRADGEEVTHGEALFLPMTETGDSITVTFTIENSGTFDLLLTGSPVVEMDEKNSTVITLTSQPDSLTVAPGASTTFTMEYAPQDMLQHSRELSIATGTGVFTCYICGASTCKKIAAPSGADSRFGIAVSIEGDRAIAGAVSGGMTSGTAHVLHWNGSAWYEEELTAANLESLDYFGYAVAISGDWAIVGAYGDDDAGDSAGAAYVFHWNGSAWENTQKLTGEGGSDRFGYSVAISGDRVIAGALYANSSLGAAYVYELNGSTWELKATLTAPDSTMRYFGASVDIFGDRVIVGSYYGESGSDDRAGSACVYSLNGASWELEQKLTPAEGEDDDYFGLSVSLYGERAVVGAYGDDDNGTDSGAAYIFRYNGSAWVQEQKLTASDGAASDCFGRSVSLSGNRIIAGSDGDDSGSVYVYEWNGSTWEQALKHRAVDGEASDNFGNSVSLCGDRAIVGAVYDDVGSVTVLFWNSSTFFENIHESTDISDKQMLGSSVSIFEDHAIVGACGGGWVDGSACIFARNGSTWEKEQEIAADDGDPVYEFGFSVDMYEDWVIVGSPRDNSDGNTCSGSAYMFHREGDSWVQRQKFSADVGTANDLFGTSVSIYGDAAIVGVKEDDDTYDNSGSAYVYRYNGSAWVQEQKITADDPAETGARFGISVSLYEDRAAVGAYMDDDNGAQTGSVYILKHNGSAWVQEQKLIASDGAVSGWFGYSVDLVDDLLIIGAVTGADSGSAYIFRYNGSTWEEEQKVAAYDGTSSDYFGNSVGIYGGRAVIGSYRDDDMGTESGSAHVYCYNGSTWLHEQKLVATDGAAGDYFGYSVALSGEHMIIGACGKDAPETDSGSFYYYYLLSP